MIQHDSITHQSLVRQKLDKKIKQTKKKLSAILLNTKAVSIGVKMQDGNKLKEEVTFL